METYDRDSRAVLYCSALFWGRCAGPARKNDNLLPRFTVPTALRVHNPRPAVVGLPQTYGSGAYCLAERAKKAGAFKSRTHPTPNIGRQARTRYDPPPRFTVPTALRAYNPRPLVVGPPQTYGRGAQCPAERAKKDCAFKSRTHPTPSIGRRARTG